MRPLKIVLVCGAPGSGKTYATERVLAPTFDVLTYKMDRIYRQALEESGVPPQGRKAYSVYRAARWIRNGEVYDHDTVARFFTRFDRLLYEQLEQAVSWGVDVVLEGYTLKFPDEVGRIMACARSLPTRRLQVSRIQLRPALAEWNRRRQAKRRGAEPVTERRYERKMTPPEPVPEIDDYTVSDANELSALAADTIGLAPHKWYQRFTLGPISTRGASDASEKVDLILDRDIVGKRVLDVCCATGVHAIMIKDRGAERVVGVERNPRRHCKSLELKKVLIRHSTVDARVSFKLGDMQRVVPALPEFDTSALFGAIHYFPSYEEILRLLAARTQDAMYIEFCFAEGEHDTRACPGSVRPYIRSKSGTTIYMGDPETIRRLIARAIPEFEIEDRARIRPPGRKLVSHREVWRLRRRSTDASSLPTGAWQSRAS